MNASVMNALSQYRKTGIEAQIMEASPHRLTQMLFEGGLGRIAAARGHIDRQDYEQKGRAISEAMSIIVGLRGSLDMERGGEVASNLNDLYAYMTERLAEANLRNNTVILDEVAALLGGLKNAWDQIPAASGNPDSAGEPVRVTS